MNNVFARLRIPLSKSSLLAAVPILIGIAGLLWGPGLLRRPDISVSCGAIDTKLPAAFRIQLINLRLMLQGDDVRDRATQEVERRLIEYSFPTGKLEAVVSSLRASTKGPAPTKETLNLSDVEENMVKTALAGAMSGVMSSMVDLFKLPDAALFFELRNDGAVEAKDVHVVVRPMGTVFSVAVDTDNRVVREVSGGTEYSLDLAAVAPGSRTKGIIRYAHVSPSARSQNEIAVSYQSGTIIRSFAEDSFHLAPQ